MIGMVEAISDDGRKGACRDGVTCSVLRIDPFC